MNNLPLPNLKILRLNFTLRAKASVELPPFLGSTLRGGLGTALKQILCLVSHENCQQCWFFEACKYQYLFKSPNLLKLPKAEIPPKLNGQKQLLKPFMLLPPPLIRKNKIGNGNGRIKNINVDFCPHRFETEDELNFSITLYGKSINYWTYFVMAVKVMAENGLGKYRQPFQLTQAVSHDKDGKLINVFQIDEPNISASEVHEAELAKIVGFRQSEIEQLLNNQYQIYGRQRLAINSQSPFRVRISGQVNKYLSFENLIKKIVERLEFLAFLYTENSQRIDYRPVWQTASGIKHIENTMTVYKLELTDSIEAQTIRDVMFGSTIYEADSFEKYLLYLIASEIIGVGSNTSYGLGYISLSIKQLQIV